jgi:hypothetical protein
MSTFASGGGGGGLNFRNLLNRRGIFGVPGAAGDAAARALNLKPAAGDNLHSDHPAGGAAT